jgi:hypothetical protein
LQFPERALRFEVREMSGDRAKAQRHKHSVTKLHALRQRDGIPYEVERQVCSSCRRVLDERPLRRAVA